MENAVSRPQRGKPPPKIPRRPLGPMNAMQQQPRQTQLTSKAAKTEDQQPKQQTKKQFASKPVKKEELDIRPKLAPLRDTRVTRECTLLLTKFPTTAKHPKDTTIGEFRPTMKAPVTRSDQAGQLGVKPARERTARRPKEGKEAQSLQVIIKGTTASKRAPNKRGPMGTGDKAVVPVCRAQVGFPQLRCTKYFHSLAPDHVADLESLSQVWTPQELHDPQQCTEYAQDIYQNLLETERSPAYKTTPSVLTEQPEVDEKHRRVLVDWLVQVHTKFDLLPDTLHGCIDILDRYLQATNVPKKELQLVGITAMFISSKYEEIYPCPIVELVYIAANTYTVQQICEKEMDILRLLDYQLGKPYPLTFLRRYSKLMTTTTMAHNLAKYFIEISYLSTECRLLLPSQLAVGALVLAARVLTRSDVSLIWNKIMEDNTWYTSGRATVFTEEVLQQILYYYQVLDKNSRYPSIAEKYSSESFLKVAQYPRLPRRLEVFATNHERRPHGQANSMALKAT